jgi:alginate O-acetyltransferase complex protein AlgI
LTVWIGIVAYATQLYFDFSGYSDMAIGLGTMLGFDFPENFNRPFSAYSITDHWRRWHITLSNWFRDYVYIPLGGSRGSTAKTYRNLFAVFIGMGVWHGAAWHYLFFGLYQGIFLSTEKLFEWRAVDSRPAHPAFRRALAVFIVLVGYVIFRADSMGQAGSMLSAMFQPWNWELHRTVLWGLPGRATLATLVGFATFFLPRNLTFGPMVAGPRNDRFANGYRLLLMLALFPYALTIMSAGTFSPFIYFQF